MLALVANVTAALMLAGTILLLHGLFTAPTWDDE